MEGKEEATVGWQQMLGASLGLGSAAARTAMLVGKEAAAGPQQRLGALSAPGSVEVVAAAEMLGQEGSYSRPYTAVEDSAPSQSSKPTYTLIYKEGIWGGRSTLGR